jgi:hypothetical protein
MILVGPICFGRSEPIWTGPKCFGPVFMAILTGSKCFGLLQNGLDRPNELDPSKTNWTDQNRFGPIEGQGINDELIKFRHNFRTKVFQKL